MVTKALLEEVKNRLIKTYNPVAIYLFGSYAWECPDEDSDLDLLIVIDSYTKDPYHTLVDGHKALVDVRIPKDIIVLSSKAEFKRNSEDTSTLSYKVKQKGQKIYAKA